MAYANRQVSKFDGTLFNCFLYPNVNGRVRRLQFLFLLSIAPPPQFPVNFLSGHFSSLQLSVSPILNFLASLPFIDNQPLSDTWATVVPFLLHFKENLKIIPSDLPTYMFQAFSQFISCPSSVSRVIGQVASQYT